MNEVKSEVPVMHFCEWCYATLNKDNTCPTEGCIHDELLKEGDANASSQA